MTSRTLANRISACAIALPAVFALAAAAAAPASAATDTSAATTTTTSSSTVTTTTTTSASTNAVSPTGGTTPVSSLPTPVLDPPLLVVGGSITVRTRPAAYLGDVLNFHGATRPTDPGATVLIQTLATGTTTWSTLAEATVGPNGKFLARWRTNVTGHLEVRAIVDTAAPLSRAHRASAPESSGTGELSVYQPAVATYFGPGFYGDETACGQVMSPELIGVANRTLPCGTKVEVDYDGRTLVVPVVDRGPYANGADWDLTAGTASALGMTETETIGTITNPTALPGLVTTTPTTTTPATPTETPAAAPSLSPLNAAYQQTTGGRVATGS